MAERFLFRHTTGFAETNFLGNVYFSHYASWQGRCREMFLQLHAPDILQELKNDLRLVTLSMSMEYFEELFALEEVEIEMRLIHRTKNRIGLSFDFWIVRDGERVRAAMGAQEIGCFEHKAGSLRPFDVPHTLATALDRFSEQ